MTERELGDIERESRQVDEERAELEQKVEEHRVRVMGLEAAVAELLEARVGSEGLDRSREHLEAARVREDRARQELHDRRDALVRENEALQVELAFTVSERENHYRVALVAERVAGTGSRDVLEHIHAASEQARLDLERARAAGSPLDETRLRLKSLVL